MPFVETIAGRFVQHAARAPERLAFSAPRDGVRDERRLTRGELHRRAAAIAVHLLEHKAARERVLVTSASALDFVASLLGCFYAGATPVPCPSLRGSRALQRLGGIAQDARPRIVLTDGAGAAALSGPDAQARMAGLGLPVSHVTILSTEQIREPDAERWQPPNRVATDDLALLQYTSGSTRTPRGVMVSHANLIDNVDRIRAVFTQDESSIIVSWLPLHHDMGLIGTVLQPLSTGSCTHLLAPSHFIERPVRWLEAITQTNATTSGAPNFAYDLCVRQVTDAEAAHLDLCTWRVAFNGAEPVDARTLRAFATRFTPHGFRPEAFVPCYGLAEMTLFACGLASSAAARVETVSRTALAAEGRAQSAADTSDARDVVACGPAGPTVRIVHPETHEPCSDGAVGEIWLDGPSKALGYWNRPGETKEIFLATLAPRVGDERRYLRTGDLAFVCNGHIFVCGRRKDAIIVRGRNLDPQDLEATVFHRVPSLSPGSVAAIGIEDDGRETLAVLVESVRSDLETPAPPETSDASASLIEQIREVVTAEHEVTPQVIAIVRRGSLPRTTSAKLRRSACRTAFENRRLPVLTSWCASDHPPELTAASNEAIGERGSAPPPVAGDAALQPQVDALVAALLGALPPPNDPLVRWGLDSLKAARLAHAVERQWPRTAPIEPALLLDGWTLEDVRGHVQAAETVTSVIPEDRRWLSGRPDVPAAEAALSIGQEALWFRQRTAPDDASANLAVAARLRGPVDLDHLGRALTRAVERHPMLSVRFSERQGAPRQTLHTDFQPAIVRCRLPDRASADAWLDHEANRPFALQQEPPLRIAVVEAPSDAPCLLIVAHHIVADLWSFTLFLSELARSYRAETGETEVEPGAVWSDASASRTHYFQFVQRQRAEMGSAEQDRRLAYWGQTLANPPAPLFQADRSTDHAPWRGARIRRTLTPEAAGRIGALARSWETTPFVVTLSVAQLWLREAFARHEFLIGVPAHGRLAAPDEQTIGYFVNLLPLRCRVEPADAIGDLMPRTRRTLREALAHQAVPFPVMVERFAPERAPGETPWIQAVVVWQESPTPAQPGAGAFTLGAPDARLQIGDVTLEPIPLARRAAEFDLTLTMAPHAGGLVVALDYREARLSRDAADQLLTDFVSTLDRLSVGRAGPPQRPAIALHGRFEQQAAQRGSAEAVRCGDEALTYAALDARANQLARYLLRLGMDRETLIALYLPRSPDLIVSMLGILKANGAYVPIDAQTPPERVARVLDAGNIEVIVTTGRLADDLEPHSAQRILLDRDRQAIDSESTDAPGLTAFAGQLAYCIHTSGSTGRPKGVLVTHANVLALHAATDRLFQSSSSDVWTMFHSPAFDFSVWEIWGALLHGGRLIIVPHATSRDPAAFSELLVARGVTVLSQTPSAFRSLGPAVLTAPQPPPLRLVIFGGEALMPSDLRPWVSRFGAERPRLVNMYGITETTVHVTARVLSAEDVFGDAGSVIGAPIDRWSVHVLSPSLEPVAARDSGEMYVGGAGVARGYLGQPGLTAERFLPDPVRGTPGARMYRSGDLATRCASGDLEYLGRADQQIKLRGFRIEPGEIEAAIRRHPAVRDAAVIRRTRSRQPDGAPRTAADAGPATPKVAVSRRARRYLKHGTARPDESEGLTAFVSLEPTRPAVTEPQLLDALRLVLPDYMLPDRIVLLDRLPVTPNGKLDRDALAAMPRERRSVAVGSFQPPADVVEAALAEIWAHVLGAERVSREDNYFLLGGDSIRALRVVALAEERGIRFDVARLFEAQTIAKLRPRCVITGQAAPERARGVPPFALISPEDRARLPVGTADAYPVARMQAGLIYHSADSPGSSVYRASFLYEFQGPFDERAIGAALGRVMAAHPILRASFDLATFREPLQIVWAVRPIPLAVSDWRMLSAAERDAAIDAWLDEERQRDFDLECAPLFRAHATRLSDEMFALGLTCHDAILDGWSTATLLMEWLTAYDAALAGREMAIASPAVTYREFVAEERRTLGSTVSADFWREELRDCTVTHVPGSVDAVDAAPELRVLDLPVPRHVRDGLLALARRAGVPLKQVLLAAHLRVLSVILGQTDVITGLEANGRLEWGDGDRVLGQHLNTVPFRQALKGGTWVELVRDTFEHEQRLLPHRRFPYAEIHARQGGRALYDTTFNYTHFHVFQALHALTRVRPLAGRGRELTHYVLKTELNRDAFTDDVTLDIIFDAQRIAEEAVRGVGERYLLALAAMATHPSQRYEVNPLLTDQERAAIERLSAGPRIARDVSHLADLIEAQVARTPDLPAVSFRSATLTYRELNAHAESLAARLRDAGVCAEKRVGVFMERSLELLVSLLAILKTGAAYVPLDPDYPAERLAFIAEQADVGILLSQPHLEDRLPTRRARVFWMPASLDALRATTPSPPHVARRGEHAASGCVVDRTAEQAAYVIFTSGSTGRPKGAINTHRAVANRLLWAVDTYGFAPGDRILQKTPIGFDVSVWELFAPLLAGAEVVMADPGVHHDPDALVSIIEGRGITTVHFVPSMLSLFLDAYGVRRCRSLRQVLCSGEALTPALCDRFRTTLEAELHNLYGPTEAAVDVTAWDCARPHAAGVPIGHPIANTVLRVLDGHGQPVPPLVAGELFIGGIAVGRGYVNAPALTAERFVPDPLSASPGARLYRTGDLARQHPDGAIEYLGRADLQIKLHGVRIELGDIEATLRMHRSVRDCAVALLDRDHGAALCAYVVRDRDGLTEVEELRAWAAEHLPRTMVPSLWVWLDALPLSPNGKLDRNALPQPERDAVVPADVEALLAQVERLSDVEIDAWLTRVTPEANGTPARETAR